MDLQVHRPPAHDRTHDLPDPRILEKELAELRKNGFATDRQENEIGAYCIGMPIFGPFDQVVGGISVSGASTA